MSRRSFFMVLALVLVLFGGAGVVFFLVVGYEPDVYGRARAPQDQGLRHQRSQEFLDEFLHLYNNAGGSDREWYVHFTDEQMNSYLEDGFIQQGLASRLLPNRVSRPHFIFEPNKVRVAFRYGSGVWRTTITIDLRVWLAREDPNAVALELEGARAGALPISGQWLVELFAKTGRDSSGLDLTWYRLHGHPVALLRFQADQPHPTLLLRDVRLEQGGLTIRGQPPDAGQHTLLFNLPEGMIRPIAD